jgi:hypothetical protein
MQLLSVFLSFLFFPFLGIAPLHENGRFRQFVCQTTHCYASIGLGEVF